MLDFEKACALIENNVESLHEIDLNLDDCLDHILSKDLYSKFDLPHFDNSAVDGFGVLAMDVHEASSDNPVQLRLQGEVAAGQYLNMKLKPGHTIKIMTGAMIPDNVEAVIMKEYCRQENDVILVKAPAKLGDNIRRHGEELERGQIALNSGRRLDPGCLGLAAAIGHAQLSVFAKPKIAFIITGNELKCPSEILGPGEIYDTNSYSLKAVIRKMNLPEAMLIRVNDDKDETKRAISNALNQADLIITTGGASVGDYDYVKDVAEDIGFETIFWRLAIKPGKPVYFGKLNYSSAIIDRTRSDLDESNEIKNVKYLFGLPGNPVSCLVTFHQLVKPAIAILSGYPVKKNRLLKAKLAKSINKRAGRLEFVRADLNKDNDANYTVHPTIGQESHMLSGLVKSNCLIHFPKEEAVLNTDSIVLVEPLNWSLE